MISKFFVSLLVICLLKTDVPATHLYIKVTGIQSNQGKIIVGIFKDNDSFPTIGKQYKSYKLDIQDKKASLHVTNLEKGRYAVGLCHDLNSNEKMDNNSFGFPMEPYGFSNNVRGHFSRPTFDEASFYFDGSATLVIRVQ
ncbi:MAG: DUF2141 domain-containing protein [Crocinitomicaceae bacterium]